MPCLDNGPSPYEYNRAELERLERVEAILCAVCSCLQELVDSTQDSSVGIFDTVILQGINWKEAGVSKARAQLWWEQHQAKDRERRERERLEAERRAKIQRARDKLTPEELALLGIK